MAKRLRSRDRREDANAAAPAGGADPPAAPAVSRPLVRPWVIALGAAVALAAGAWWWLVGRDALRARDALASLSPVAASVPPAQAERREAMEIADRLLAEYPDSPEALYARGVLLFRYGFNDEAVKTWKACLALVPDVATVYERLGIDAFQRGRREEAVQYLSKAIELDPQSPAAGVYLGETLNGLGRMDDAVAVLEQFIEAWPDSAEAYFQLGQAHLYRKDYRRARECHTAALQRNPLFAPACYGLATACERLGETESARHYRDQYTAMIAASREAEQQRARQAADREAVRQTLAGAYVTAAKIHKAHGKQEEAQDCWRRAAALDSAATAADTASFDLPAPSVRRGMR